MTNAQQRKRTQRRCEGQLLQRDSVPAVTCGQENTVNLRSDSNSDMWPCEGHMSHGAQPHKGSLSLCNKCDIFFNHSCNAASATQRVASRRRCHPEGVAGSRYTRSAAALAVTAAAGGARVSQHGMALPSPAHIFRCSYPLGCSTNVCYGYCPL